MLRSFRVANHRSIRAEQELLLMPAYDKTRPVVPVAALFGANASGKTNLLDALRFMQTAVVNSYGGWDPRAGVPRTPFRLDPAAADEPSVYVVELLLDGVRHIYGFEVDDERVREEWLYAYPRNRRQVIFDREGQHIRPGATSGPPRRQVAVLEALLPPTALFLSLAGRSTMDEVAPTYRWFAERLDMLLDEDRRPDEQAIAAALETPGSGKRLLSLIRAADMGIERISVDSGIDGKPRLLFHHSSDGPVLTLAEEAHGTRVWMSYLMPLLRAFDTGGVLVIDELELSLHPRLTDCIIALFKDTLGNHTGAQLLFATHESALLRPYLGEDILARDEVWFVEKDRAGMTTLYALSDFKPRKQESTHRRYLSGVYGAIPELYEAEFGQAVTLAGDGADARAAS